MDGNLTFFDTTQQANIPLKKDGSITITNQDTTQTVVDESAPPHVRQPSDGTTTYEDDFDT